MFNNCTTNILTCPDCLPLRNFQQLAKQTREKQ